MLKYAGITNTILKLKQNAKSNSGLFERNALLSKNKFFTNQRRNYMELQARRLETLVHPYYQLNVYLAISKRVYVFSH